MGKMFKIPNELFLCMSLASPQDGVFSTFCHYQTYKKA